MSEFDCSFAGVCVGHFNHRYYLCTSLYAFIGCLYATWWHASYVASGIQGTGLFSAWQMVLPHLALLLRYISAGQFFVSVRCPMVPPMHHECIYNRWYS